MRTFFAHMDCNDEMKNMTGTESWNILKVSLIVLLIDMFL